MLHQILCTQFSAILRRILTKLDLWRYFIIISVLSYIVFTRKYCQVLYYNTYFTLFTLTEYTIEWWLMTIDWFDDDDWFETTDNSALSWLILLVTTHTRHNWSKHWSELDTQKGESVDSDCDSLKSSLFYYLNAETLCI